MSDAALRRARHIKERVVAIRNLLRGRTLQETHSDLDKWSTFERHLEVISEASRHVPAVWKEQFGTEVPWRQIADVGNVLRHGYDQTNATRLWLAYTDGLDPLEAAIDAMLAAHRDSV